MTSFRRICFSATLLVLLVASAEAQAIQIDVGWDGKMRPGSVTPIFIRAEALSNPSTLTVGSVDYQFLPDDYALGDVWLIPVYLPRWPLNVAVNGQVVSPSRVEIVSWSDRWVFRSDQVPDGGDEAAIVSRGPFELLKRHEWLASAFDAFDLTDAETKDVAKAQALAALIPLSRIGLTDETPLPLRFVPLSPDDWSTDPWGFGIRKTYTRGLALAVVLGFLAIVGLGLPGSAKRAWAVFGAAILVGTSVVAVLVLPAPERHEEIIEIAWENESAPVTQRSLHVLGRADQSAYEVLSGFPGPISGEGVTVTLGGAGASWVDGEIAKGQRWVISSLLVEVSEPRGDIREELRFDSGEWRGMESVSGLGSLLLKGIERGLGDSSATVRRYEVPGVANHLRVTQD